jgi:D-alanine transfer protein
MQGNDQPEVQTPHLAPALTALVLGGLMLLAFGSYARSLEHRSILRLSSDDKLVDTEGELYKLKNQGTALQQASFAAGYLLPIYGSSELNIHTDYERPYHPTNLFHEYPTGFTIFPVGKAETTCLIILQKLAAVGPGVRGRKVAISLSPSWFFERLTARSDGYAGNFSALHAGELAFNTRLSLQLRQDAARRMMEYPATLADRPLLKFALENLADGSPLSLARYYGALPLGMAQNAILRYQDHWGVVSYLWKDPDRMASPTPPRRGGRLDWPILHRRAESLYRAHCDNNEFGLDNGKWNNGLRQETLRRKNTRSDEAFLRTLRRNQEWVDLELLLRELTELGAEPLLLSMPIHGSWYDQSGITYAARRVYYQQLREISARYRTEVIDFADHDSDQYFCHDYMGHLSPRGWVHYGQSLDDFFHGALPSRSVLSPIAAESERPIGAGPQARATPHDRPPYEGFHDASSARAIEGWVWDPRRPDAAIEVEIYDGLKLLGRVPANEFRRDLQKDGKGNGRHAFHYPIPSSSADRNTHSIRVKVAGSNYDLKGTPRDFSIAAPAHGP